MTAQTGGGTRRAEILMALCLAAFSVYLMVKSAELPVGWIKGEGPGGGAFPFWLSAGMLLSSLAVIWRWYRRQGRIAQSNAAFFAPRSLGTILIVAGAVTAMIALVDVIGVYLAVPLFLLFYVKGLGRHSWAVTLPLVIGAPIFCFFFFEVALNITLPKGVTEPLFYPLYDIFL